MRLPDWLCSMLSLGFYLLATVTILFGARHYWVTGALFSTAEARDIWVSAAMFLFVGFTFGGRS